MGLLTRILRRDRPPVGAVVDLDPDERVTAWGVTTAGVTIVATPRGLWLAPPPAPDDAGPAPTETDAAQEADAPANGAALEAEAAANGAAAANDVAPGDHVGRRRIGWAEIHKAAWNESLLTIVPSVEVEPGVVADAPTVRLRLAEPRGLPAEVRARVTRSVAHSVHRDLPGGGVLIVARRLPGTDGLTWLLRFDDGTDRADPEVRERAAELLDEVRAESDLSD